MNISQTQYHPNPMTNVKHSIKNWVRRTIIDFDPYDQETLETQILLKDWDLFQEEANQF